MQTKVNLNKEVYNKEQYEQVIDTSFTQLIDPLTANAEPTLPTVEEFFQNYNDLFFEIPKTGDNSHETLIVQSTEYINYSPVSEELQALTEEITSLREQLLEARQQLADLTNGE
jgi:hypothetical protein